MEPLLSPLHDSEKPAPELENRQTIDKVKQETNVIRCKLDLSILPTTDRQRLIESWRRANRFKNEVGFLTFISNLSPVSEKSEGVS